MTQDDILSLIHKGVAGKRWADLGAGGGDFARALSALLGSGGAVYAVDRDARAIRRLQALATEARSAAVVPIQADFTRPLELEGLDGILIANALHFTPDQAAVLRQVSGYLKPGGRLLVVEYDKRAASPWVPFPVSFRRFKELAAEAGLSAPLHLGSRRSAFGGEIYAALSSRP